MKSAKTILYVLLVLFPLCGHSMEMKHSPADSSQEGGGAIAISSPQSDLGHQIPASVPDEGHELDPGIYSQEQQRYLELIKKIDLKVYDALIACGKFCNFSCLVIRDEESRVLQPSDKSGGYPTIVLQRGALPNEEFLRTKILPVYKEMLTGFYVDPDDNFSFYRSLAIQVNPAIFEELVICPGCFRKAAHDYQGPSVVPAQPYPLIIIPCKKKRSELTVEDLKRSFEEWYDLYSKTSNRYLSQEEREHFLKIIGELAPELYAEFRLLGDEIFKYFRRDKESVGCSIYPSSKTGLPEISCGSALRNYPIEWQKFYLAHELGHYCLQHCKENRKAEMPKFLKQQPEIEKPPYLLFDVTFTMARRRGNEHAADEYAVMNFGINPADGIELFKNWIFENLNFFDKDYAVFFGKDGEELSREEALSREEEFLGEDGTELLREKNRDYRKGLRETHPQDLDRIKHLKSLQMGWDLQKARGSKPQPPDWKALMQYYKELFEKRRRERSQK